MGKKITSPKVKKGAVREFSVGDASLRKEKKKLNSKRILYGFYTAVCFILVFAIAGAVGYLLANGITAESQRIFMNRAAYKNNAASITADFSASQNFLYAQWWYMPILYAAAVILVLALTGKNRIYHLVGFGFASAGALFLTFYLSLRSVLGTQLWSAMLIPHSSFLTYSAIASSISFTSSPNIASASLIG